ncbi:MAG: BamA/TamA family outer membrane protein [Spirochaetes bacterium]|nr:BamA/TamA family outer membrane protein [Spirochaetota bacterium]
MYLYKSYRVHDYTENGYLENSSISGMKNSTVSAPGISVAYDSRDSSFYPTRGIVTELTMLANSPLVGASESSLRAELDTATYFNLHNGRYVLGFHGKGIFQSGDVTYQLYEGIGGDKIVRGYLKDRYKGRNMYAVQSEIRFPFAFFDDINYLDRLSGVAFAGAGSVADDTFGLTSSELHYAAGLGLRYSLNQREKINLRIDFTLNRDGNSEFYFQIMEAF